MNSISIFICTSIYIYMYMQYVIMCVCVYVCVQLHLLYKKHSNKCLFEIFKMFMLLEGIFSI